MSAKDVTPVVFLTVSRVSRQNRAPPWSETMAEYNTSTKAGTNIAKNGITR
jgi:hypothetical protein